MARFACGMWEIGWRTLTRVRGEDGHEAFNEVLDRGGFKGTGTRGKTYGAEAESDFNNHKVYSCRGENQQLSAKVMSTFVQRLTKAYLKTKGEGTEHTIFIGGLQELGRKSLYKDDQADNRCNNGTSRACQLGTATMSAIPQRTLHRQKRQWSRQPFLSCSSVDAKSGAWEIARS